MDVRILQEQIEENLKREVHIINPTSKEFVITHNDITYTLTPSGELKLPYYTAELFVKRVVDYMGSKRDAIISPAMKEAFARRIRLYDKD